MTSFCCCCCCWRRFVSENMGGAVTSEGLTSTDWNGHVNQLKQSLNSNVLPLGLIKTGFFCHRALLFKACFVTLPRPTILCVVTASNVNV